MAPRPMDAPSWHGTRIDGSSGDRVLLIEDDPVLPRWSASTRQGRLYAVHAETGTRGRCTGEPVTS